jgi:CheY-like chemotaxis protein
MAAKRALIVDDSKSARVVLSRMLQKYDIEVDTAESAEAAIHYLVLNRPDVIFMDHLMPGMDGFQAVQAIKNNPRTATIPIMMYTSQEGELYVGQARALGAVGVLPKLVKPVDVSKVLYQLHLLPDRRDHTPPAFIPANEPAHAQMQEHAPRPEPRVAGLVPADWHPQLEAALRNHDAELRRFMVASLDSYADRIVADIRGTFSETPALQTPPPQPERKPPYLWILAMIVAVIPGIVLAYLYTRVLDANRGLAAQQQRLGAANLELRAEVDRLTKLTATAEAAQAVPLTNDTQAPTPASAPGSAQPRVEPVPYGETPFSGGRLEALRQMLADLQGQSFKGVIRAQSFGGRFCLVGNATEGYALAPTDLPAARCDVVGNPFGDSLSPAQRQSLAFANLAASLRKNVDGGITVEVVDPGDRVVAPYPTIPSDVTAGVWNEAAGRNNRVELIAVAAH